MNTIRIAACILLVAVCVGCGAAGNPSATEDAAAKNREAARPLIVAALNEACLLEKAEDKADAYLSLIEVQLQLGDTEAARHSLDAAISAAAVCTDQPPNDQSPMWPGAFRQARIVGAQASLGALDEAKATAAKIANGWDRAEAYVQIAAVQVKNNDKPGALATLALAVDEIEHCKTQCDSDGNTLYKLISTWSAADDIPGIKAYIAKLPDNPPATTYGYMLIVQAQAKAGDIAGAYETIELAKTARAENQEWQNSILSLIQ